MICVLQSKKMLLLLTMLIMSVVLHEYARAWCAFKLGDRTAKNAGRFTLNPLPHISTVGTLLFPSFLILFRAVFLQVPLLFAWAKPVPLNPYYFKNPPKGMMFVSFSGLAVNAGLVLIFSLCNLACGNTYFKELFSAAGFINIVLFICNLIPLPLFDGWRIVYGVLPHKYRNAMSKAESYGIVLVVLFVLTGVFSKVCIPAIMRLTNLFGFAGVLYKI